MYRIQVKTSCHASKQKSNNLNNKEESNGVNKKVNQILKLPRNLKKRVHHKIASTAILNSLKQLKKH